MWGDTRKQSESGEGERTRRKTDEQVASEAQPAPGAPQDVAPLSGRGEPERRCRTHLGIVPLWARELRQALTSSGH